MDTTTNNRLAFFRWLRATSPHLYSAMLPEIQAEPQQMAGFFDFLSSVGSSIGNAVSKAAEILPGLAQTYVQTKAQVDLIKVNVQRAQNGQAPVTSVPTTSNSGPAGTSPGFFESIPPWGWAVGGVLAFLAVKMLAGGRR